MGARKIKARELLADIAAGMDDGSLMEKYGLSARALLKAMTALMWEGLIAPSELVKRRPLIKSVLEGRQRRIVAKDILFDLRSGMGEAALMEKYELSPKGLQRLFERLVDSHMVSHSELYEMSPTYRGKVDGIRGRQHNRAYLTVPVPIYETQFYAPGLLRDISRKGFRVAGIESTVGEIKRFEIPLDMIMKAAPIQVVGECRWVAGKGRDRQYIVAGYEIKNLTEADEDVIRKLINHLLFTDSGEWQTVP